MARIVCAGQKGGIGKSTLARALAVGLAQRGFKVILADMDIGQRTLGDWKRLRDSGKVTPSVNVISVDIARNGFDVPNGGEADYIIYDCPGWSDEHTRMAAAMADLLVLPTGPGGDDLRPLVRLCNELREHGIGTERVAVAFVRSHTDAEVKSARAYLNAAELTAVDGEIREAAAVTSAHNKGRSAIEAGGEKQIKLAHDCVDALIDRVTELGERDPRVDWDAMDWDFA